MAGFFFEFGEAARTVPVGIGCPDFNTQTGAPHQGYGSSTYLRFSWCWFSSNRPTTF